METPTAIPPTSLPRLRVSRQNQPSLHDLSTSQAGPSRLHSSTLVSGTFSHLGDDSDREQEQVTPRIPTSIILPSESSYKLQDETPAARLRAVLDRTSSKSRTPAAPTPSAASATEFESDFDIPEFGSSQPSLARESLNGLFSHALREPGNTPQKSVKGKMKRRNSIDVSEFESSPRTARVKKERSVNKGKRRSMSDDELSSANDRSQAAILDTLRQRLDSVAPHGRPTLVNGLKGHDDPDESFDTVKFLENLNTSQNAPVTSTPQHSLKMSVNSQFHSNLLEHDSEMHQAMRDLDSYEHSKSLQAEPSSILDTSRISKVAKPAGSPRSPDTHNSGRRTSKADTLSPHLAEKSRSERARSRSREPGPDPHDRERSWNRDHTNSHPGLEHATHKDTSYTSSPGPSSKLSHAHRREPLSRRESSSSVGLDDEASSNAGHGNHYGQLLREREQERNAEREHSWNKSHSDSHQHSHPHPTTRPVSMSSPSVLSPPDRTRTISFPSRPDSRLSTLSPHPSHHRHHSRSSSRASSPNGSLFSLNDEEEESKAEVDHERERNWNAPRPNWHQHPSVHHRPSSSIGVHSLSTERVRKLSFPDRPDSRLSMKSPGVESSRSSSRASSSKGSTSAEGLDEEVVHEQERNWNSPRPHWNTHSRTNSTGHGQSHVPSTGLNRSHSLTQRSFSPSSSTSSAHFSMDTSASARRRAESLKTAKSPSARPSTPVHVHQKESSRPRTSLSFSSSPSTKRPSLTSSSRPKSYPARPNSPLPPLLPPTDAIESRSQSRVEHKPHLLPSSSSRSSDTHLPKLRNTPSPVHSKIPNHSSKLSSPSTSPNVRSHKVSDVGKRPSHIPIRSPSRSKPVGTVLFPALETSGKADHDDFDSHLDSHREQSEMQPTSQEIPSVYVDTVEDEQPLESDSTDTDQEDEENHQVAQESTPTLRTNSVLPSTETPGPAETSSMYKSFESETRLQKLIASPPSPPPSPPSDGPSTPETSESPFVFPSTPPRKPSFSTSKLEFQTPSPPKNLPDLPGPPSTSSDDEELPPISSNLSSMKTPKPPGAWAATPAPSRRSPLLRSNSLTDTENDSGLATPAASLSRAASLPPQTPGLPGGWLATPAPGNRKSVRFHPEPSVDSEQNTIEEPDVKIEEIVNDEIPLLFEATDAGPSSRDSNAVSKPASLSKPGSPTSPRRSPRKAATVRVVDAFGREEKKQKKKSRQSDNSRNNSIRVVDAMGRVIDDLVDSVDASVLDDVPLTQHAAIDRVRSGLRELAQTLNDEESLPANRDNVRDRIKKLEETSRDARESRSRLGTELSANAESMKAKLAPLRASMQKTASLIPTASRHHSAGWSWLVLGLMHLLIMLFMYRFAKSYARNMFLTTYYDPLYPDLHYYTSVPTNYCSSSSVNDLFWREGFRAAALKLLDYLMITFTSWRVPCQHTSYDVIGSNTIWPPT